MVCFAMRSIIRIRMYDRSAVVDYEEMEVETIAHKDEKRINSYMVEITPRLRAM